MNALFLCLLPLSPQVATLQVQDAEAIEWVADLPATRTKLLLPLSAGSDRIARAVATARGLQWMIAAPEQAGFELAYLRVWPVMHSHSERVLLIEDAAYLVSDETLPADIRTLQGDGSRLGLLARQDQAGVRGEVLTVQPGPEGHDLVLLPLESDLAHQPIEARPVGGEWAALAWSGLQGHALRLDGATAWEIRTGTTGLDQVFHARLKPSPAPAVRLTALDVRRVQQVERVQRARGERGPRRSLALPLERGTGLIKKGQPMDGRVAPGEVLSLTYSPSVLEASSGTMTLLIEVQVAPVGSTEVVSETSHTEPAPLFQDVAQAAGVFDVHFEGPAEQLDIRPTMGPGAAWGDFDGNGFVDLYLVQGGGREGSARPANRLMRNRGDGTFEHVPGADDTGAGMGALFFDLDGDGDLDLYVANYGADVLYRNDGSEGFTDISAEHDLAGSEWSAGVCAGDYDGDGDLDLYVTSYLVYDTALMPPVEDLPGYAREDPTEMLPFAFPGAANTFLENVDGKLLDRTAELGVADEQGRGMQPVFWDFDLDGDQDLYVANDVSMNVLYRNEGDGTFKDISFQVGMDDPRGGMGVATGDVDMDGDFDLFLTNWELEANALYRNNHISSSGRKSHTGTFQDVTVHSRLGRDSVGKTSWGGVFFDADNDGDLDLFVPNGYTSPDYESTRICVGQPNQFFLNDGTGRFEDVSASAGSAISAPLASRTAAVCDYDGDGRLDLFVTNNNGPYQLLRNQIESQNHWIGVELRGSDGNTAAIGARAELVVDGLPLVRHVRAGGGYLAGHASGLHFGLGQEVQVADLRVHWPSGHVSTHPLGEVDRWITIEEPAAEDGSQEK